MKPGQQKSAPEEQVATLPILRQDVPTITGLRAELKRNRFLVLLPMALVIVGVVAMTAGTGLVLGLGKIFPRLESGRPMTVMMSLLLIVLAISFLGGFGLPVVLPAWVNRQIRGREGDFCDTQLIGDLIDTLQATQWADSGSRQSWYGGCMQALLQRTLPEIGPLEAAVLTNKHRDFLVETALSAQTEEKLVLPILRSASVWGDIETLSALLMLARTAESEAIRAAAYASLAPLKVRLLAKRENAALVYSLEIPALPS